MNNLSLIALLLGCASLTFYALIFFSHGPVLYVFLICGVVVRPLLSLGITVLSIRVLYMSFVEFAQKDLGFRIQSAPDERPSLFVDVLVIMLLSAAIALWHNYGRGPMATTP